MKRRNLFLSLLLVGACTIVGVGYAAISRDLKIGGQLNAAKNDSNLKVRFNGEIASKVEAVNPATTLIVGTPTITNDHAANFDVSGMVDIGDKATAYFLIENASQPTENLNATLSIPNVIVNNGTQTAEDYDDVNADIFIGDHFKITAEYVKSTELEGKRDGTGDFVEGTKKVLLEAPVDNADPTPDVAGETIWVKVTVELIDVIIADFNTHNITVSFSASTK